MFATRCWAVFPQVSASPNHLLLEAAGHGRALGCGTASAVSARARNLQPTAFKHGSCQARTLWPAHRGCVHRTTRPFLTLTLAPWKAFSAVIVRDQGGGLTHPQLDLDASKAGGAALCLCAQHLGNPGTDTPVLPGSPSEPSLPRWKETV